MESVHSIQTVHALGLEQLYLDRFKRCSQGPYQTALRLSILFSLTYAFSQVIVFFAYIITFRFGAFQVTLSQDSVASALFQDVYRAFSAIIFVSIGVGAVGAFIPDASKAIAAVHKVFKVINRPLVIDPTSGTGCKPDSCSGGMQFNAVTFSYPCRKKVKIFNRLNLSIADGCTVGLVGASGCGKSTIMTLLQRFYDPGNGSICLNDTDIKELNLKWLRSQMGLVSQEPVLFDTTIADNIRYGALFRDVSEDEIISVAKKANIHSFIETLPMGYNTNVGAKGTQLSGGQKQRIAIARALVRDPKILLLDEATSALDTESEKVVQEALDKAREGRTTIIIAHRLSTIQNADKIVVMEEGKVVEEGPHSALVKQEDGVYYRMLYHQHKAWRKNSMMSYLRRPTMRNS